MLKKLFFILSLLLPLHVWAEECPAISKKMDAMITEHIQKERGVESCKYRYVYKEMGIELVLFSVTGSCLENMDQLAGSCGNKNVVYVAGVISGKVHAPIAASDASGFSPSKVKMAGEEIILTGLTYGKTDPLCCPSVKETRTLKITESGFQE